MNTIDAFLPFINLVLAILATIRCVRTGRRGWALFLWLLLIWLVPIIGPIITLALFRHESPSNLSKP